jgi:hypothetical protein
VNWSTSGLPEHPAVAITKKTKINRSREFELPKLILPEESKLDSIMITTPLKSQNELKTKEGLTESI